jgi:hypothetical protein
MDGESMKVFSRAPKLFGEVFYPAKTEYCLEHIDDKVATISWNNREYNQSGVFTLKRDSVDYQRFLTI